MGLSKLSKKCRNCPFVKTCDHKQTEAYGYLDDQLLTSASSSISESMLAPVLRETMEIHVDGKTLTVYKDDVQRELYKALYPNFLQMGG